MALPVNNKTIFVNDGIWKTVNSTEELIKRDGILDLSLTSVFAVDIKASKLLRELEFSDEKLQNICLLAYEAVLPGSSFELGQVFGDRQGVTEQYPTRRVYPPIDVSFYIKYDYDVLRFFDGWMNLINPLNGNKASPNSYFKFNYPSKYECDVNIVKFERELRPSSQRLTAKAVSGGKGFSGGINDPRTYTYSLINAFPANIISAPVSYSQSDVLRTTITFNYDRYVVQQNEGKEYIPPQSSLTTPAVPNLPPLTAEERERGIVPQ